MSLVNPGSDYGWIVSTDTSVTLQAYNSGTRYVSLSGGDNPVIFTLPNVSNTGCIFHFERRTQDIQVAGGGANIKTPNGFTWTAIKSSQSDASLTVISDGTDWRVIEYSRAWFNPSTTTEVIPSLYDKVWATGNVNASAYWEQEIDTGMDVTYGIFQFVYANLTSGTPSDTVVEIYDGDPSGAGVVIYQSSVLDIPTDGAHADPNIWWAELAVNGIFWVRVNNNGPGAAEYNFRARFKGDE